MKYRHCFSVHFSGATTNLLTGVCIPIRGAEFVLDDLDKQGLNGKVIITLPIDSTRLSIRTSAIPLDDSAPNRGIDVPEKTEVKYILRSGIRVLSFVLESPIAQVSSSGRGSLIPESQLDEECLRKLDSLPIFMELSASISIRALRFRGLDAPTLDKMLSREVGLALYSDALNLRTPTSRFRELWRVLESAFGQRDSALLTSLANYQPAVGLDFDKQELTELCVLRGRASHAESSSGLREYHTVSEKVEHLLPRLESLVIEVLLTKKSWGNRGLAVERLAPLQTYVGKDGISVLAIERNKKKPEKE